MTSGAIQFQVFDIIELTMTISKLVLRKGDDVRHEQSKIDGRTSFIYPKHDHVSDDTVVMPELCDDCSMNQQKIVNGLST